MTGLFSFMYGRNTGFCADGTLTASQQHPYCPAAAMHRRRFTIGEHLGVLAEPVAGVAFQQAVAAVGCAAFTVDDVDATQLSVSSMGEKVLQQAARGFAGMTMQIKFVLYGKLSASQLAQSHARQSIVQELRCSMDAVVRIAQGVVEGDRLLGR